MDSTTTYGGGAVSSGGATGGNTGSSGGATPMAVDAGVVPSPTPLPPATTGTATSTGTTVRTCQAPSYTYPRSIGLSGENDGTSTYASAADAGVAKGTDTTSPPSPLVPSGNGASNDQSAAASTKGGCAIGSGPLSGDSALVLALLGSLGLLLARRNRRIMPIKM
jgi:hypothetical protein